VTAAHDLRACVKDTSTVKELFTSVTTICVWN